MQKNSATPQQRRFLGAHPRAEKTNHDTPPLLIRSGKPYNINEVEFACQESSIGKGNPLWPFDSFCIFGCIGDPPGLLRVEEAPAELADEALKMALVRRNDPKGCVHHSDSKNVASRFCGNRKGAVSCSWNHVAAS